MGRTAVGAGNIIMGYWGTDVRARYKDDKSVVTEADLRSNGYILEELSREYPDFAILSEESEDDLARCDRQCVYVVDPLDGSGDFKRMEDDFCVLIALTENGETVMGVVYEPSKRRLFSAQRGEQARVAYGVEISDGGLEVDSEVVLDTLHPSHAPLVRWDNAIVGHPKNYKGDKYDRLYKRLGIPEERLKRSGSMGTRMMQTVMGENHVILGYTTSLKEWDIAAGHAILEARGMSVTDIQGNPLRYNQMEPKTHNGILVAHPDIKDEALHHLSGCLRILPL